MTEIFEARLKLNPIGPYPYMVSLPDHLNNEPIGMVDILIGSVQEAMEEKFGDTPSPPAVNTGWFQHVHAHTEFATVRWEEEDLDDPYEWEIAEIEIDDQEGEWFSRGRFDYPI